jgi:hypothetical protein
VRNRDSDGESDNNSTGIVRSLSGRYDQLMIAGAVADLVVKLCPPIAGLLSESNTSSAKLCRAALEESSQHPCSVIMALG